MERITENNSFKFWCPIEKAQEVLDPTTGEQKMLLGGIASTSDEDADGEFLDPKGFDIKPLIESGMVNWHHQAKGQPAAIIGEPTKAEIRPEGLYIETELYPSSKVACDVWELANTLERDSKTRRLGYSIEGKVVKRKSNNPNSPDYKRILKAIITGVAITHQPKNPKTFANIIKGEIDDDWDEEEEENENVEEKSLNAEDTGKALKRESVDGKIKNQTFGKSAIMERLFKDIPGISIEKAEQIHSIILKIADMKNKRTVTEEDIQKAYEALGLEIEPTEDVEKGGDGCCANGGDKTTIQKSKAKKGEDTADDEGGEEEEETEETTEEETETGEEDGEEETEKGCGSKVKKGGIDRFSRIEKAMATSHQITSRYIKALGVMIKDASQKLEKAAAREEELLDIVKGYEDTISDLSEKIEAFGSEVPAPKSLSASRPVERAFDKGMDAELEKGRVPRRARNQVSMSEQPGVVSEILDQATFSKGYDEEFSKACTTFEASKVLPQNIISRIRNEFGIEIVK